MMENLSIGEMLTAASLVIANAVGIKWLRTDLNKQRDDIGKLFTRMDKTMPRQEIKELVTECVGIIKEDTAKTQQSVEELVKTVNVIREDFIRIDERYKALIENTKNGNGAG